MINLTTVFLMLLTTNVSSFQQVPRLAFPSASRFMSSMHHSSITVSGTTRTHHHGSVMGLASSPLWRRKEERSVELAAEASPTSSSTDSSSTGMKKVNKVAVWATIAAGTNFAYWLYTKHIGGGQGRATWIGLGVMTQVAGFLIRTLQGKLSSNNGYKSWLRNLLVFQSVGLSLFSHGVFGTVWTKALMGISVAIGIWAFKREVDADTKSKDIEVSYPLLATLRVNELVQLLAAKKLFVPILIHIWPRVRILNKIPLSNLGAIALAILPSILQCAGTILEGDYAEGQSSPDGQHSEGERLIGYVCYVTSFLLWTFYITRGCGIAAGGGLVGGGVAAGSNGFATAAGGGRRTGKRAPTGVTGLPFDIVMKLET